MKKNYTAPEAEILCFRPAEELANLLKMDDLLQESNPGTAADKTVSDIFITIW